MIQTPGILVLAPFFVEPTKQLILAQIGSIFVVFSFHCWCQFDIDLLSEA